MGEDKRRMIMNQNEREGEAEKGNYERGGG